MSQTPVFYLKKYPFFQIFNLFLACLLSFAVGAFTGKIINEYSHSKKAQNPQDSIKKNRTVFVKNFDPYKKTFIHNKNTKQTKKNKTEHFQNIAETTKSFKKITNNEKLIANKEKLIANNEKLITNNEKLITKNERFKKNLKKTYTKKDLNNIINTPSTQETAQSKKLNPHLKFKKSNSYNPFSSPQLKNQDFQKILKGSYTVQMASYPEKQEALLHIAQLKKKGHKAFYTKAIINGEIWFRVNIGHFQRFDQALKFHNQLISKTKKNNSFIQKIK